jgi:hypothetical protein
MGGALQGYEGVMSFRDPKADNANQINFAAQGKWGPYAAKEIAAL